jgi:gluconolactonase
MRALLIASLTLVVALRASSAPLAHAPFDPPRGRPDAIVDLGAGDGVRLVRGQWRYHDARIVEVAGRSPGADLKPSGALNWTYDISPQAGAAGFDDSAWDAIAPESLEERRARSKVSFNWYRIAVTIPDRVGALSTSGSTVAFEIVVDDYAEVWVDGRLPVVLGQAGGSVVKGFNAPNRVILTRDAMPGQRFQIAVFGINGPISAGPNNFIWVKSATLDFYRPAAADSKSYGTVLRLDPSIDAIVPADARIEKLADGFGFTEGPVWHPDGYLLFSDPNENTIYRYSPDGSVSIYRTKSGYKGFNIGEYKQPGSNGLTLDRQGRLTIDEHGNRRVTRLEKNGVLTILADRYQGKRLNSPNDLVYRSDGTLYFTDPPFGLPKFFDDPRKELAFSGVFKLAPGGELELASKDLAGPNGIAFSPDEKFLYVTNWDEKRKVVMRYDVDARGDLSNGAVFFDMGGAPEAEALDGMKVDRAGNLFVSGPGGVWILSAQGKHLGTLRVEQLPANMAWGDEDGRALYLTARTGLYRIRLSNPGIAPFLKVASR